MEPLAVSTFKPVFRRQTGQLDISNPEATLPSDIANESRPCSTMAVMGPLY